MTDPQQLSPIDRSDDDVEQHACPKCDAQPGSPFRSRGGAVASAYHTRRFTMVPRLKKALRVPTPADRGPGRPGRPGTPPPAPIDPDLPSADIRIGYARCSTLGQELDSQLDALSKHGIPRDKIFSEKISTRVRVRPKFEAALAAAREIKAHAPHCRVIFTVYEMKRLGRDAAELTAHGLILEMLAGPLPGIYDPTGPGKLLFAFFAAMAETERENIRESTLEGLDTRGPQGQARRPADGHHRRHAPHRAAAPRGRRVCRADPARPDHPHRQAQGPEPLGSQHLPGTRRATPSARRIPKPSPRPTPTSPLSRPAKSLDLASLSPTERHSDYRELLVTSP
ncbi:recombinase family protein [Streptomyces chryseus]